MLIWPSCAEKGSKLGSELQNGVNICANSIKWVYSSHACLTFILWESSPQVSCGLTSTLDATSTSSLL